MTHLLLDTHALLWALEKPGQLSRTASTAIMDPANQITASAVSIYEIEYKTSIGRLPVLPRSIRSLIAELGFSELPITPAHAEHAARIVSNHRDPWDRILAAQAAIEDMTVVTVDPEIAALGARTLW